MTTNEAKWAERVQGWRASGKSAEAFAEDQDFKATTLRFWASKLKSAEGMQTPMMRVIRRRGRQTTAMTAGASDELTVCVGAARVLVRRGFDADLLRAIAAALAETK